VISLLAAALLLQGGVAPVRAPVVSAQVSPEAPGIGEVITIEIRVRAPAGSDVRFPALPDSLVGVEALDPRALRDASTSSVVDRTAVYRLIAFDTGRAVVRIGDVVVTHGGTSARLPVTLAPLRIRSVLPADSAERVPRPARALLEVPSMRWRWWLALAVVLVLALWVRWSWRRARVAARAEPEPAIRARASFAHVRALGLIAAGEPGRHVIAQLDVVRAYLAARFPTLTPALSGEELLAALPEDLPILPERLRDLIAKVEPVAFAHAEVTSAQAEQISAVAAGIVEDIESAWVARLERERLGRRPARRRP
jgi:hypothetical protein